MPDRRRLLELARQALDGRQDRLPELVWGDRLLRVWNGLIVVSTEPESAAALSRSGVVGEPAEANGGDLDWELSNNSVRPRHQGGMSAITADKLTVLTLPNRPKSRSKKWLQEMRIPPWWRRHLPVLWSENVPVWLLPVGPLGGDDQPDVLSSERAFATRLALSARFELSLAGLPVRLIVHRRDVPERRRNRCPGLFRFGGIHDEICVRYWWCCVFPW
jgi:hypothetical protein